MNPALAALLGATAGAMAALAGSVMTNLVAIRNERFRHEEAKHAAYVTTLRKHIADAFSAMFELQHAINWITWFAKNDPCTLSEARIRSYDDEVHTATPKCLSMMTAVASLNLTVYEKIQPTCEVIYGLDRRVSAALHSLDANREQALGELWACLDRVIEIERTLPRQVAQIMSIAEESRPMFQAAH